MYTHTHTHTHTYIQCLYTHIYTHYITFHAIYLYAAWKRWNLASIQITEANESVISIEDMTEEGTKPEDKEYLEKNKGSYTIGTLYHM